MSKVPDEFNLGINEEHLTLTAEPELAMELQALLANYVKRGSGSILGHPEVYDRVMEVGDWARSVLGDHTPDFGQRGPTIAVPRHELEWLATCSDLEMKDGDTARETVKGWLNP